jgi:hypothetical protein
MHAERTDRVVITRGTKGETVNGKPRPPRVYITGPHFGVGRGPYHTGATFSSTESREEASVFERWVAEGMVERKSWQMAELEDTSDA